MATIIESDLDETTDLAHALSDESPVTSNGSGHRMVGTTVHLKPGERIPGTRYRIRRWLGEGSAGVVYECEHIDIERLCAIKVLRPEVSPSSRRAKLFREEARAASRTRVANDFEVGSPYIVEIYDFGELPDGRLWFAMELLRGKSLASELGTEQTGSRIEPGRAIGILRQVCKGLGAAHDVGVIHRDVKPPNIMLLTQAGRQDCVKLVDFGVAAMLAEGTDQQRLMVGTPHYMAPEQTSGEAFDHRLDIYAVGCTAYRMLTGRPPFVASRLSELLRMHREDQPQRPSEVPGCEDLPRALEDVVLKCLAKNPLQRWRSMADLEAGLCEAQIAAQLHTPFDDLPLPDVDDERREAILQDMPDPARGGRVGRRSRWVWPATVLASVAMVAGAVAMVFWRTPSSPTAPSNDVVEQLVERAHYAAAQAFFVYPPVEHPNQDTAYTNVLALEERDTDAAARKAANDLRDEFAGTLVRLGNHYWEREGGKPFAIDYYAQALLFDPEHSRARERAPLTTGELAVLRQKAASLSFEEAELTASKALVALAEPDDEERKAKLREVFEDQGERAMSTDAHIEKIVRAEGIEIEVRPTQSKAAPPKPTVEDVPIEVVDEPDEPDEPDEVAVADELEEIDVPEESTKVEPSAGGSSKSRKRQRANQHASAGMTALRAGRRDDAARSFNRALELDGRNPKALMGLSIVYYHRGSYAKAVRYGRRAVARAPRNADYRIRLGDAYYKSFEYREAHKQYERAAKLGHRDAKGRLAKTRAKLGS